MHWPVPADAVQRLLPAGLTVDLHAGTAYVGLVPFVMEGVKLAWMPEALASDFLETNLRTYVHVAGADPGVYFFSLDAASRLAVAAARRMWRLPYFFADMRLSGDDGGVRYEMVRAHSGRRLHVHYETGRYLGASAPGTFEHWLVERYLLHLEYRGRLYTGHVHHAPYPVQEATIRSVSEDLFDAAGLPTPRGVPPVVHYAEGVDVDVFPLLPR